MTCKDCLHNELCEGEGTDYSKKGGAEQCYYFIEKEEFCRRFLEDLIGRLSEVLTKHR